MSEVEKFLFNRREAALSLGISIRSVDYLIAGGKLETRRIGKKVLVTRESLRLFARGHHTDPIRPTASDFDEPQPHTYADEGGEHRWHAN
jgi:hypothetical protein